MIKLDISSIIFYYILTSVILIIIVWLVYSFRSHKRFSAKEIDYIWKCSVCSSTYVASKYEDISVCPLCGSYNKKGVEDDH